MQSGGSTLCGGAAHQQQQHQEQEQEQEQKQKQRQHKRYHQRHHIGKPHHQGVGSGSRSITSPGRTSPSSCILKRSLLAPSAVVAR